MTKLLVSCLAFLVASAVKAQGIKFEENESWTLALEKAKAENKLIFVDAYTTWCGPCKKMSAEVFTKKDVGDFYNKQFINLKLNMEAGDGPDVASQYRVSSYPQLLWVNGDGDLVHYGVGYMPPPAFLKLGQQAANPATRIGSMLKLYEEGKLDNELAFTLLMSLESKEPVKFVQLAEAHLAKNTNWGEKNNVLLLMNMVKTPQGPYWDWLWENRVALDAKSSYYGGRPSEHLYDVLLEAAGMNGDKIKGGLRKQDSLELVNFLSKYVSGDTIQAQVLRMQLLMPIATNYIKPIVAKAARIEQLKGLLPADFLNEVSWLLYTKHTNLTEAEKKLAMGWADESVQAQENSANTDTYARWLALLGMKAEAKTWAERSIALGKANQEDVAETEKFLASL